MGAVCFFKRIGRELRFEIDRLSFGRRRPNNCLESGGTIAPICCAFGSKRLREMSNYLAQN
jgi:hypothetical protein